MSNHSLSTRARRASIALLTAVGLLSGVVFTAPTASAAAPWQTTAHAQAVAKNILNILNAERKLHHLPTLKMNALLVKSAHAHNLAMARANTMAHQLRGEASLGSRITATHYRWNYAGENIAWNSDWSIPGATFLEALMYNELPPNDGHRLNILSSGFRDVGVDIYYDTTHHKLWMTEDFGRTY